jgi:asparagine synthase (glutamine-hydrolysing)
VLGHREAVAAVAGEVLVAAAQFHIGGQCGGEGKYVLKKALEPHLPHDIMYRAKKGFSIPLAAWLRGPLRQATRDAVLGPRLLDTGIFDRRYLDQLVTQHESGKADHSVALWSLMTFEAFLRVSVGS